MFDKDVKSTEDLRLQQDVFRIALEVRPNRLECFFCSNLNNLVFKCHYSRTDWHAVVILFIHAKIWPFLTFFHQRFCAENFQA